MSCGIGSVLSIPSAAQNPGANIPRTPSSWKKSEKGKENEHEMPPWLLETLTLLVDECGEGASVKSLRIRKWFEFTRFNERREQVSYR